MVKQSREAEKAMKNLQLQVAGMSQPIQPVQPIRPLQPYNSNQFVFNNTQIGHPPFAYRNPQPLNRYDPGGQAHGPPPRGERYCANCAPSPVGTQPLTTQTSAVGDRTAQPV
ncbi:hypothetical protein DAPPUDRAFT_328782 [Daphnia pulex]|uniref:Uncharacterized protein n=1 Tax=Daphnia pulex TaxID=6669 RepID=E9HER9_DAPPU|nr:hypothetical protein DAPPUDRAFT_328782 [Daphnia pulex]|eukprot:EFX69764.1 hypothetical protein DAPPUDRAFT_328782 [Daphnia pulex]